MFLFVANMDAAFSLVWWRRRILGGEMETYNVNT